MKRHSAVLGQQIIEVLLDERAAIKACGKSASELAIKVETNSIEVRHELNKCSLYEGGQMPSSYHGFIICDLITHCLV